MAGGKYIPSMDEGGAFAQLSEEVRPLKPTRRGEAEKPSCKHAARHRVGSKEETRTHKSIHGAGAPIFDVHETGDDPPLADIIRENGEYMHIASRRWVSSTAMAHALHHSSRNSELLNARRAGTQF